MSISERDRHDLYLAVERVIGTDQADTMMSMLPPVGWADVATKHDLAELERRIDLRFEAQDHRFDAHLDRALRVTVLALVASQTTLAALILAAIGLAR